LIGTAAMRMTMFTMMIQGVVMEAMYFKSFFRHNQITKVKKMTALLLQKHG
jgi:hypothetical protein